MKKKMGSAGYWLVAFMLILAIACGGGGGGGGGNGGGNGGGTTGGNTALGTQAGFPGLFLEFQNGGGAPFDPLNLRPGTQVRVQGVSFDQAGNKTVLATTNVSLSGNSAGAVLDASRNLSAGAATGFFTVTGNVTFGGSTRTISQEARFTTSTIQVQGTVNTFLNAKIPKYLQVDVFDNNGTRVGAGTVGSNGVFRVMVTTTAANRFTFNENSIDNFNNSNTSNSFRLYKVLRYQGSNYTAGDLTCAANLPAVSATGVTLPATVFIPEVSSGPPPPPSGCN